MLYKTKYMVKIIICFKCSHFFYPMGRNQCSGCLLPNLLLGHIAFYYQNLYDQFCIDEHPKNLPVGILGSVPGYASGLLQN